MLHLANLAARICNACCSDKFNGTQGSPINSKCFFQIMSYDFLLFSSGALDGPADSDQPGSNSLLFESQAGLVIYNPVSA